MNPAHLHIILNHIPVIGIPFGTALMAYGFLRKSQELKTTALLVFVTIALATVPTFLSGEAAEEVVEHLPGVSEHLIETHERAATIALIATSVLGALSLLRLLLSGRFPAIGGPVTILVFVLSLGVAGWLANTANLGGQIRHSEIRESPRSVAKNEIEQVESQDHEEIKEEDKGQGQDKRRRGRGRGRGGRDR